MFLFIVFLSLLGINLAGQQNMQEPRVNFLLFGNFICEGKDAGNYSFVSTYTMDSKCSPGSVQISTPPSVILCSENGQKTVNSLLFLAASEYPAGAYYQFEALFLVLSGNLIGKYLYVKEIALWEAYLKKCSSVLGLSYTSSESQVLIIDQIHPKMFFHPGGAFNSIKKISNTVCQGQPYKI